MKKYFFAFFIGGLACLNLIILTIPINSSDLSLDRLKSALAWDPEDGPNDRSNKIDDPYPCFADYNGDGENDLKGYSGNSCVQVWVCPDCYCYVVTCP